MTIRESTTFLVTPAEASMIIEQATHEDLNYSWLMYQKYWELRKDKAEMQTKSQRAWETYNILAFMFNVGKICGIRSERAKRAKKMSPVIWPDTQRDGTKTVLKL